MKKYSIEAVLPHQAPMILIDSLNSYHNDGCVCDVTITENSPFYNETKKGVANYIGSEYMAQAIAAYAGALALNNNNTVKIGFLLGSRKYKAFKPYFKLNEKLSIKVEVLYQEESGLSVFECEITSSKNEVLAQAKINVFQPQDPMEFLENNLET